MTSWTVEAKDGDLSWVWCSLRLMVGISFRLSKRSSRMVTQSIRTQTKTSFGLLHWLKSCIMHLLWLMIWKTKVWCAEETNVFIWSTVKITHVTQERLCILHQLSSFVTSLKMIRLSWILWIFARKKCLIFISVKIGIFIGIIAKIKCQLSSNICKWSLIRLVSFLECVFVSSLRLWVMSK